MSRSDSVSHQSSPEAKIRLFRSLFRGRDDVYARRFESRRSGRSGYQPACANEWMAGVCEKPRVKCAVCPHRRFLPLTDSVIRQHLTGLDDSGRPCVVGVYPMLEDETCFFLAIDLDKSDWQEDAAAIRETCQALNLPIALERSRSGNGVHAWLFFDDAVSAALARRLGSHILTETMKRRPEIGLASYDRFFPNQDTLPTGGFGNLIALPLQKLPRERGNSVFIDTQLAPHPDQWAFLSNVRTIDRCTVETCVRAAEERGSVIGVRLVEDSEVDVGPWFTSGSQRKQPAIAAPLPDTVELTFADQIYVAKADLPPELRNRILRLAAFQNPEFYRAQALHISTYGKPRVIGCAEDHAEHIGIPRGCLNDVKQTLSKLGIKAIIRDERCHGNALNVSFHGTLRSEQVAAARAMLVHDTGVLCATTAFGKTVVAAWIIAHRRVNTLVLVHRRQLLQQWVDRLAMFLDLQPDSIGRIGGGHKKATGVLDVAVVQSLMRKEHISEFMADYGQLIVDECHHVSARSFEQVIRRARARYVLGLSATVTRKDGQHPIVFMQCGPMRHRVDAKTQAVQRPFHHVVIVRPTSFRPTTAADPDKRVQFQQLYTGLIADEERNQRICNDVVQAVHQNRSPLILTERKEHLDEFARRLTPTIQHVVVLCGGMGKKQAEATDSLLAAIPCDEPRVLLATGRYIGEGFDDARLDTLFLTLPVSWRGTIAQYAGRLHRLHAGKREVRVYDYADLNVPMLSRMFDRRCRGYKAIGYSIQLPGSAVPGWPADIPLPVAPEWKTEYAASVRRLVRDGVDASLASLFATVAGVTTIEGDSDGDNVMHARSDAEVFLYHRLQSLPETAGLFQLNAKLPIPFDGWGQMEVDFLCSDRRLVIELDGKQHLSGPEAYRCDRRKDALLQENGYFVLRFLAADIAKRLDDVLDTILRTVSHLRDR